MKKLILFIITNFLIIYPLFSRDTLKNKGLECDMTVIKNEMKKYTPEDEEGHEYNIVYWFEKKKDYFLVRKITVSYKNIQGIDKKKYLGGEDGKGVSKTPKKIEWDYYLSNGSFIDVELEEMNAYAGRVTVTVDRENLEITKRYKFKDTIWREDTGICKVFKGKRYIKDYIRKRNKEINEKMKNNKI